MKIKEGKKMKPINICFKDGESINNVKGIEVTILTKIEAANLNSNGTEGVISVLKKVKDPVDMKEYVRVSGQSVKFQLKQVLAELGEQISTVIQQTSDQSSKTVLTSQGDPEKFIDDDLFGYMIAKGNNSKLRTAPVRTNGMISIFPYQEDRDFGVRYDPNGTQHNIYETEISTNIMRSNYFIEADRVGVFSVREIGSDKVLENKERLRRIKVFLSALLNYHGGAHLSRMFTKIYPEILVILFLNKKIPVIGDNLRIKQGYENGKYNLDTDLLKEVLVMFDDNIIKGYIVIIKEKFNNLNEIHSISDNNKKIQIVPMNEFKEKLNNMVSCD